MRRGAAAFVLVFTGSLALFPRPARAQEGIFGGMQKGVETVFSTVSTTTTFASGAVTKTDTTNIYPALTLNLDALVYPNLRLNAGGVWELNRQSTRSLFGDTDSTITRNRPFFLLRSVNPVFSPGIGYFRREDRARTAGLSDVKLVNDEYAAYLGWNPAGGPLSDFQFLRTHTFDGDRAYQDVTKDFGSLNSNYDYKNLGAYYRGSYLNTDDQLRRSETRQVTHSGRVNYSSANFRRRLLWNATYNINHQDLRTLASGIGGEVALPLIAYAGLSAVSDLPTTTKLSQNALLIDGNLTAGAGVDLGLPAPAEDAQARNLGIDFLSPTEVNRLLVWVDRDLPVEVANSFSWDIYSSPDNVIWRREEGVLAAPFGPFENRFQIDFPAVSARYIKAVTRPLSVVVPESSRFPDILVTEVQAFMRRPAGEIDSRLTRTTHLVNTDVRLRLLDAPSVFYEGYYLYNGPDTAGASTDTLSNGVSMNHSFGRIYSVYARGAREQGSQPQGYRVATVTNATFTVAPVPTFRSTVLYTGQNEEVGGLPNSRRGLFVQNAGQPYRGVDVLFGFGWSSTRWESGEISRDRLVNASATIAPRQHVNLVFSFDDTTTERSGAFVGDPRSHLQRVYGALAVDPTRTLHLVLGGEVLAVTGRQTRTTLDFGTNWSPFPDGTLQFVFDYSEALRALEFGKDRSALAAVRWNVSRRSYIDVSYQRTKSEFVLLTTETRVFSVSIRFFI
ncbi:MAG: hypothetical protein MUE61_15360 [Vicinamibacterales bacterium]|nr:hypothetical protein [Vicinamibacterales bacterium]